MENAGDLHGGLRYPIVYGRTALEGNGADSEPQLVAR
jgi:hypothetical protein